MAAMTEVLVVRHGETDWNREHRWQGHGGPGLNDVGRAQAAALAHRLSGVRLGAIYTSDLPRAVQTAEIIAAVVGLEPVPDAGLREVDVGSWRGLTRAEVRRRDPAGYRRWLRGEAGWEGGETYDEMHSRVVATFDRLRSGHPRARILLVSHGGCVRAVVGHVVGTPAHDRLRIDGAQNCSLTTVTAARGALRLAGFNDVGHLRRAG